MVESLTKINGFAKIPMDRFIFTLQCFNTFYGISFFNQATSMTHLFMVSYL